MFPSLQVFTVIPPTTHTHTHIRTHTLEKTTHKQRFNDMYNL